MPGRPVFYAVHVQRAAAPKRAHDPDALGLALGVGLVVTVSALAAGLDRAGRVLKPLTGVGTDMTVTRPISLDMSGGGFPQLSEEERRQLQEENGPRRFGLRNLGKPGTKFSRDDFVAATQLSFPTSAVSTIAGLAGVSGAAGGLTLNAIHVEGTVPGDSSRSGRASSAARAGPQVVGPRNVDIDAITVSGVDQTNRELGAITPGRSRAAATSPTPIRVRRCSTPPRVAEGHHRRRDRQARRSRSP